MLVVRSASGAGTIRLNVTENLFNYFRTVALTLSSFLDSLLDALATPGLVVCYDVGLRRDALVPVTELKVEDLRTDEAFFTVSAVLMRTNETRNFVGVQAKVFIHLVQIVHRFWTL